MNREDTDEASDGQHRLFTAMQIILRNVCESLAPQRFQGQIISLLIKAESQTLVSEEFCFVMGRPQIPSKQTRQMSQAKLWKPKDSLRQLLFSPSSWI